MNQKRTKKILFLPFSIISILFLFTLTLLQAQKIEHKNGWTVIYNDPRQVKPESLPFTLEFVRKIGDVEATDENTAFYLPSDVAVDKEGNIYILDTGNHRIQKFAPDGKFLVSLGRKGQGPGEFYFPSSLCLDSEGNLYVADPYNKRIEILTPEGKELKTIRLKEEGIGKIRYLPKGQLIHSSGNRLLRIDQEEITLSPLLQIIDTKGNILHKFVSPYDFDELLVNRQGNQLDFALSPDGYILVSFYYQNRIEKYTPEGKLIWQANRRLNYEPGPKGKGILERKGSNVSVIMPKMNRCSSGIGVDGQGRVWVATLKRQLKKEEEVGMMVGMSIANGQRSMSMRVRGNTDVRKTDAFILEIFSPEGHYIGAIPTEIFIDGLFIYGDRLFLLDKMRGCSVYEYKIVGKATS